MALAQFTSDWNDTFGLKITVAEIKKPTQSFLFGVFEFFLDVSQIDCDKLKAKMDERHYKIWVVKYFNDFFKVCYPKCSIRYGDLLKPDSKKVLDILRFLLNYHLFAKAVQKEVVDTANKKLETYNQLLAKKNQLQLEQEEVRIQTKCKEKALKDSVHMITQNKKMLEELEVQNEVLTTDLDTATQQLQSLKDENTNLDCQVLELRPLIVTDDELNSLLKSDKECDIQISNLNDLEENIQSQCECFSAEMVQLNAEIEELSTNINESSIVDSVEKCRDELKNLTELNNKIKEYKNRIENAFAQRNDVLEHIKSLEGDSLNKRNELTSVLENCQKKLMEMESVYKRRFIDAKNYEKKIEIADQQVEELKATQEQLIQLGTEVIENIKNT